MRIHNTAGNIELPSSLTFLIISSLILIRSLIGFHPHSGQGDDHKFKAAYGGDFEAQRHWMEITLHLPISSWYHYDLNYWGLDYPPLTAYVSLICGYFSQILVGPESVSLFDSRGIEDPLHKSFMRATVLALDVAVYFPAVWVIASRLYSQYSLKFICIVIFALIQPAIILIDHGHFQYNTVALGLSLWSFHFMTKNSSFGDCVLGSLLFCMALNFKQMILYFSPAVFMYLLGRCFSTWDKWLIRFSILGVTVIVSFGMLWWPFFFYPYENILTGVNLSGTQSAFHVLQRLFPFQRGLFEGKVSNIWCALSTKPFSIRTRIPEPYQPILALILTLILLVPLCIKLFELGLKTSPCQSIENVDKIKQRREENHHLKLLLWGTSASGLSFFLASFQVHEKSILMALSPLSLLFLENPLFVSWFATVATWTLWPLLTVDQLKLAYVALNFMFLVFLWTVSILDPTQGEKNTFLNNSIVSILTYRLILPSSIVLMAGLHLIEFLASAPTTLPDLYTVLWSIVGCACFSWSWIYCNYILVEKSNMRDSIILDSKEDLKFN